MEAVTEAGSNLGRLLINLSEEFPGFLDLFFILMTGLGVLIIISSLIEIAKMGKAGEMDKSSWGSVFWKQFGGGSLAIFAFTINAWTKTLWANDDPLNINAYVVDPTTVTGAGDLGYGAGAIMAAMGIIVLTGVVTMARAYIGIARLGKVPESQRGDLWGYIVSRLVAGSALISALYIVNAIGEAAGVGGFELTG